MKASLVISNVLYQLGASNVFYPAQSFEGNITFYCFIIIGGCAPRKKKSTAAVAPEKVCVW